MSCFKIKRSNNVSTTFMHKIKQKRHDLSGQMHVGITVACSPGSCIVNSAGLFLMCASSAAIWCRHIVVGMSK